MKYIELEDINEYKSESINPAKMQEMVFELYSVPVYETGHPEYLTGKQIASSKIVVRKNDILLCKINPRINRVWIVKKESENVNIASSEWIVVRSNKYNPEFLAWYFRSPKFRQLMVSEVTGIGGSLTRAQPKRVAKYPVPVIDRNIQDKIVYRLNKIYNIIDMKKRELAKFDSLIQSRFIEEFGDLKINPKKWEIKTFDEMTDLITDGEHATPRRTEEGIYLLSARNIMNHTIKLEDVDYIDQAEYDRISKRIHPKEGDVLISCSGTVGRCCSVPAGLKFQMVRSVALLRFKNEINPIFAEHMITSDYLKEQINRSKTQSSQANLFQGKIKKLKGFVPPIDLQNQFAAFVQQINKSKFVIHKFLYCTTHNTQSIIKLRPNTKESGKTRGGKPYADEF